MSRRSGSPSNSAPCQTHRQAVQSARQSQSERDAEIARHCAFMAGSCGAATPPDADPVLVAIIREFFAKLLNLEAMATSENSRFRPASTASLKIELRETTRPDRLNFKLAYFSANPFASQTRSGRTQKTCFFGNLRMTNNSIMLRRNISYGAKGSV